METETAKAKRPDRNAPCSERVEYQFNSTMADIRVLTWLDTEEPEDNEKYESSAENDEHDGKTASKLREELGELNDYGLSLDIVQPGTFEGQRERYKRYQICWGGPSSEFRIFEDDSVEFWFMDWFDGASVNVTGEDAEIIRQIVEVIEWKYED